VLTDPATRLPAILMRLGTAAVLVSPTEFAVAAIAVTATTVTAARIVHAAGECERNQQQYHCLFHLALQPRRSPDRDEPHFWKDCLLTYSVFGLIDLDQYATENHAFPD
jgi:hypothetical protein